MSTRYYNPEIGRFLNADKFAATGQGVLGNNVFVYCMNNAIQYGDSLGDFPVLIACVLAVCTIGGAILGATSNTKLGVTEKKQVKPQNSIEIHPKSKTSQQILKSKNNSKTSANSNKKTNKLTTKDRIRNAALGAAMGLAVGGAIVATGGAIGSVAVGSATTTIGLFGATGAQTFAIGALSYDFTAMFVAPFIDLEMEPIEIEP